MFATIIVLVALILVTPSLLGRPQPTLSSLPILIVAVTPDHTNLSVYVAGSVQAYMYDDITLNLTELNLANVSVAWTNRSEPYAYGLGMKVPLNLTYWHIHVWLLDQQGSYFEYNVSVHIFLDPANGNRLTLAFTFPDDNTSTVATRVPPDDFRIAIPRRGTMP